MRKMFGLLVLALVWVGLPAAVATAAPLPGLECGQIITTSVRLRHDLICPQGFLVTAPFDDGALTPVTVDLAGHTLGLVSPAGTAHCSYYGFYPSSGYSCPITSGTGAMLLIENGTVAGSVGSTDGGVELSRVHVEGETILSQAGGPNVNEVTDGVRDSRIDGGIADFNWAAVIQRDVVSGGISTNNDFVGQQVTITNNLIEGSPTDGITIVLGFYSPDVSGVIADNIIIRSTGSGISAEGTDLSGLLIERNWLIANGADGIRLGPTQPSPASATITGNIAIANAGHGVDIDSVAYEPGQPGVPAPPDLQPHFTDGGQNMAVLNRTAPQCIGVTCGR